MSQKNEQALQQGRPKAEECHRKHIYLFSRQLYFLLRARFQENDFQQNVFESSEQLSASGLQIRNLKIKE